MRPTLSRGSVLSNGVVNSGIGCDMFAQGTCKRITDLCKRVFVGDRDKVDESWQQVRWRDWCTVVGRTLSEYYFPDISYARQYLWGRVDLSNDNVPIHRMALEGNEDMVVLGVMLAQGKSWLNLVSSLGGLLHCIIHSSCGSDLVRFMRGKGCYPGVFDRRGDNAFHIAAMRGRCDAIEALFSEISTAERAHPTYLVTAESIKVGIDLNTCYNSCGMLLIHSPFLNGAMSRENLVQTILSLQDLEGAKLDACDGENGYTLHQFFIAKSGNDLEFMLDKLCPFGGSKTNT